MKWLCKSIISFHNFFISPSEVFISFHNFFDFCLAGDAATLCRYMWLTCGHDMCTQTVECIILYGCQNCWGGLPPNVLVAKGTHKHTHICTGSFLGIEKCCACTQLPSLCVCVHANTNVCICRCLCMYTVRAVCMCVGVILYMCICIVELYVYVICMLVQFQFSFVLVYFSLVK